MIGKLLQQSTHLPVKGSLGRTGMQATFQGSVTGGVGNACQHALFAQNVGSVTSGSPREFAGRFSPSKWSVQRSPFRSRFKDEVAKPAMMAGRDAAIHSAVKAHRQSINNAMYAFLQSQLDG